ncbi:dipeptide ABC transporter ATP-binding protein [Coprothermobacteraceae bacterium]|nr:dipeptide ABC transporter ATP-binding protein [Coprothermobacteraceae bacterium]
MNDVLLEVHDLVKWFPIKRGVFGRVQGHVKAVDGVSFSLRQGETLGLVGESGSGKTTIGRLVLKLIPHTRGRIVFEGVDITSMNYSQFRPMKKDMQIIFQDPYSSLNPRMTVGEIIAEPLLVHTNMTQKEREKRVYELLEKVTLRPEHARRYPHEFSGGQRQRIGIARALALNPKFIVADEPISALDVSIQAQITNLLIDLQRDMNISFLFIAHDLSVVKHMADSVLVLYLGKPMEYGKNEDVFVHPRHPYTQALLSAVPVPDPDYKRERIILQGEIPSPIDPPKGCVFHTRCPYATDKCKTEIPQLREVATGHFVACHYA